MAYAAAAHDDQVRKGTDVTYVAHLLSVAALVLEHGGSEPQAVAAVLHDVVEDCGGTQRLDDVRATFGEEVAQLVHDLSDAAPAPGEAKAPWPQRKQAYLAHLAELADAGSPAVLVSCCDKLHNAEAIVADATDPDGRPGLAVFDRFSASADDTGWYYGQLADVFARADLPARLVARFEGAVAALRRHAAAAARVHRRCVLTRPSSPVPTAAYGPRPDDAKGLAVIGFGQGRDRAERLLTLACVLQVGRPLSLADLRQRFELYTSGSEDSTRRQFERDKQDLRALGIDVVTRTLGDTEAYAISTRLPAVAISWTEEELIALATLSAAVGDQVSGTALAKVSHHRDVMPDERPLARIRIDLGEVPAVLAQAQADHRRVRFPLPQRPGRGGRAPRRAVGHRHAPVPDLRHRVRPPAGGRPRVPGRPHPRRGRRRRRGHHAPPRGRARGAAGARGPLGRAPADPRPPPARRAGHGGGRRDLGR